MRRDVFVVIRLAVTVDDDDAFADDDELAATVEQSIDHGEITVDGMDVEETEVMGVYSKEP